MRKWPVQVWRRLKRIGVSLTRDPVDSIQESGDFLAPLRGQRRQNPLGLKHFEELRGRRPLFPHDFDVACLDLRLDDAWIRFHC